tara:strand:- start:300 stop:743 length:444 start_codon:yes stop_codon:yes gene_type:complete
MTSRFKIQIKVGEEVRWADAGRVFAHLLEEYTKAELKGKKPTPYKDKVNDFFSKIDDEWMDALKKAYPNVDVDQETQSAKMWLLSNPNKAKANFKTYLNNWMAKAMRNGKPKTEDNRGAYQKYVPPVINDEDIATPEEIQEILKGNR